MKTHYPAVLLACLLATGTISAQQFYIPLRTSEPVELDGLMAEPDWQKTPVVSEFMQESPDPGLDATERTEVRIMYDDDYLYISVFAFDREPDKLIRTELQRDFPLGNDDGTGVTIDTYHDKLTGMSFVTNTLNARWDAQITRDGDGMNSSFNTFWDARTTIHDKGYHTEYRIPFSSLRFEPGKEVVMGIRIARLIKRKNELVAWPPCNPATGSIWNNVSFAMPIKFTELKGKNPFYAAPYAIANFDDFTYLDMTDTSWQHQGVFLNRKHFSDNETLDKIVSNIGLDVKYGVTRNFTLDLTLNTDFAQAEVDDRIINLTKYEVNLPEKRNFFLESANALSFGFPSGNEVFITRRIGNEAGTIVPILGGARVTGKSNGWLVGALNMQTTGVMADDTIHPHNFTVARVRKDIDSLGSFVGGILTNRYDTDGGGPSFQVFGADFVKRVSQQFAVEGGFATSMAEFELTDILKQTYMHIGTFKSASQGFTFYSTADLIGDDVQMVMGYLDDTGYGRTDDGIQYQWQLADNEKLQYFYIATDNSFRWRTASGNVETLSNSARAGLVFENGAWLEWMPLERKQDSLFFDWQLNESNAIAAGTYTMYNTYIGVTLPTQSTYNVSFESTYGDFYGGKRIYASAYAQYYFNTHFNGSVNYEFNNIGFNQYLLTDSNTVYTSNLYRLSLNYNFSTRISLKAYIQYEDLSDLTSANFRFRYNPQEGTDLYLVVNEGLNSDRNRLDPRMPVLNNQAVVLKFVKTFSI